MTAKVAQSSSSAVSQTFSLPAARCRRCCPCEGNSSRARPAAECNSAIQQSKTLRYFFLFLALAAILTCQPSSAAPPVIISEFMAINNTTLADENGTYSDWIELYNSTTSTVNLGGWFLSNKATNLTQWSFPSTNLGPNRFLIVFASNKNRRVPGAPLHTNFKLAGSGEYLALVLPDGVTKSTEFAPTYPPQYPDISYGYVMTGVVTTLVAPNAGVRALVPASDIGVGWRYIGFNDSTWTPGTLGAGFDTSGNYAPAIGLDLRAAMLYVNASAYLRVPFTVSDPALFNLLSLSLRYDDGFVAYLNGSEVLRRNTPATPAWNSSATAVHGAPSPGFLGENFEGPAANYTLTQYGASPAPAVQPGGLGSTGKFLRLLYDGINGSANTIAFPQTAPGLFQTVTANFDFRISSAVNNPADGFAFMLIPTSLYGTNGPGVNITSQAVEKPNYQGVFGIGFSVYPHYLVNDVSAHWNGTQYTDVTVPTSTLDLAAGLFHHARITLQYVSGGALATVTLIANINGIPGTPFSPITNLFIPGLNPFDCRVQFGGRTGGLNLALDLDNCNVQFTPPQGPIAFEDFDISSSLNLLNPGENLLAIQGLNASPANLNFLIQPQLGGGAFVVLQPATYLYPPTPGAWNNSAASATAPPSVTFWPPAGVYSSNVLAVSLGSSSSSAAIYYTLDGSAPTTNSAVYTNPIQLSTNAAVRARAQLNGVLGDIAAANYILLDPSITNFTSNLPLVIIDTLGQTVPDGSKIGSYSIFVNTNPVTGRATLSGPLDYLGRLSIGLHGSSSLSFPKKPFAFELNDEAGNQIEYELLGFPYGNDWLLYPPYSDKTLLNNFLSEEIFRSMGHYAVRCLHTELFMRTTPGKLTSADYQGVYVLIERIRVDSNRVDIAKLAVTDNTPPAVTGGYIISKDRIDTNTDIYFTTTSGEQLLVYRPKPGDLTQPQYDYISGYVNAFEAALYGSNWRDPITGYAGYIDVDSFVDQHWIVEYTKNIDGYRLSNYMNKDRNGKLKMEPIWDWDLSWGNADYADGGHTNSWYYPQLGDLDDIWLRHLRTDPDFYQKIIDRWGALRLNLFNGTNLLARIDQLTNYLYEAQARDFARWPRLGTYVWPNPNGAAGGWDVDYVSPTSYDGIIAQYKKYVLGRYLWIDQQFVPAPTLVTNGSLLSMSAPIGSIYYTLDNTDPRASGGGIGASARLYSGTVTLTNNAGIVARALYTNAWSAPAKALYIAALPSLRITEINYHPAPPPPGSPYQDKDFEFLEIQNTGPNVINLAGVHIGGGVDFTFEPSEFVLAGTPTTNSFDGLPGATAFTASTLGQPPGPYLTNDAPAGNVLCLLNSATNTARNRVTFNQTATGNYDRVISDFDFRASTVAPPSTNGTPTLQNFDSAGTPYTLTYSGSTPPVVLPPDTNSTGNFLRLVPASGAQLGVITFNRSATGAFNSVTATFDFRITPPAGAGPADGFGFALLNTSSYGISGAGPSFAEEPNLANSIGIGFDVYNNASTPQEPNNNHISLHWGSSQVGNAVTPSFIMANGRFHRAQINIWFWSGNAYVTVRLTPDINGIPGPTETVLENALIYGVAPYQGRVAFGARTGGLWASHDLDNINVQFTSSAAASAGLSLLFLPVAQFGSSGPGSALATFTDQPLVNNTLALDFTFNPSNLVNDISVFWNAAWITTVSLPTSALELDSGAFHHAHLELDNTFGGAYAVLSLTPNSLSSPGTPITVFSNLFVAGAILGNNRLEFAGRNGGLLSKVDLENVFAGFQRLAPMLLNPGESIVVVHNQAAFISRYGTGIRIAGEFSGSLANEGENLTLLGPLGEPILNFNYNPAWYPITDGGGFTLVPVNPNAPPSTWGLAQNWRPSSNLGGSPGSIDPPPPLPVLGVSQTPGNSVSLSWPASSGIFNLYSALSLDTSAQWPPVTNPPLLVSDRFVVTVPVTALSSFYRLQGQRFPGQ